jgi:hypothetical protein
LIELPALLPSAAQGEFDREAKDADGGNAAEPKADKP